MENEAFKDWFEKSEELITEAVNARKILSTDEIEDLRARINITRALMTTQVLLPASNQKSAKELYMDGIEGSEFKRMVDAYSAKINPGTEKKYTTTVAESIARKAVKAEGTKYYKARESYLKAKDLESTIYQLLKALDGLANSLSAISK